MSTSNSQVAHVWAQGNGDAAQGSNFSCRDNALYSYSTCVGVIHQATIFISDDNMTPSTGKQLSHAKRATSYRYFTSPAFYYGRRDVPTAAQCILAAVEAHAEQFTALLRARKPDVDSYTTRRQEIIDTAARFSVIIPEIPEIPEATGDLKEKATAYKAAEKERNRIAAEKAARDLATRRELDAEQFSTWITTGAGSCPASYQRRYNYTNDKTTDYITLRDDAIVTSLGAEAPLDHVIRALAFYDSRKVVSTASELKKFKTEVFTPYHTNGHKIPLGHFTLDSIDEAGNVKAGCHVFTAAEIARFQAQWSL